MFPFPLLSLCQETSDSATSLYITTPSEPSYPLEEEVQIAFSTIPEGSTMSNPRIVITGEAVAGGCDVAIISESPTYSVAGITGHQPGTYEFHVVAENALGDEIVSQGVTITFS